MATDHDVVIVGAGFAGIYAAHKMRDELDLTVHGIDAAGDIGGSWWWNRYPGARCDFESVHYSYSFSEDLQREWQWTERYAGQKEILSYLNWVADRLDVRKVFKFSTEVTSMQWDESAAHWKVGTNDGAVCTARFVLSCVGGLSLPKVPEFVGVDSFKGELYFTSTWPHHDVDFTGKRIAVIGTGSSGVQIIPEAARTAGHLTVFQRTPNYVGPLRNQLVTLECRRRNAEDHAAIRAGSRKTVAGVPYSPPHGPALAFPPEKRREIYDEAFQRGGINLLTSTFIDIVFDQKANDTLTEYLREHIRGQVKDPVRAEQLCPYDHPYATKRPVFGTDYYETFNLPHVDLVDLRSAPIKAITPTGVQTAHASYEFDMIILATGFDVYTGSTLKLGAVGRGGQTLRDSWIAGPRLYLGLQTAGFPNLFMITGPQSTVSQFNTPLLIEDHIDFATGAIKHMLSVGASTIEPTPKAEEVWNRLTDGILARTLYPKARGSYYTGENVVGKPRAPYVFLAGAPLYRAACADVQRTGYGGFAIDGDAAPLPPKVRLDPDAAMVLAGMLNQGFDSLADFSVDATRFQFGMARMMQTPGPAVRVEQVEQPLARIFIPDVSGPLPVVVLLHGGGWVAGSIDILENAARRLSKSTGAVVVTPAYRLAPESPFPAAPEDAFAALRWVHGHIAEFGGDPRRIAIMGESAGANLSAVAALRARDSTINLVAQVLIYPPIDPDIKTESQQEFGVGPFISHATGLAMWKTYLNGAEVSSLAAPSRAETLSGLPPTLVLTVELDPLRDEGEQYAKMLEAAGVPVKCHRFDGLFHGAFVMDSAVPRALDMEAKVADFLRARFATPATMAA